MLDRWRDEQFNAPTTTATNTSWSDAATICSRISRGDPASLSNEICSIPRVKGK
ncbi:hypothetical protein HII36_26880 [Nonomuraea sp. NN258]|uniref:hypothetical protein n=1 Tax=Nonomuraea antri TaxID=2730852 RepID=UPI001568F2EC|nr:hypothetical protein [Nonomuraea antri]NRQ35427.1 hypothetical protein [Nonomuraea antri]